VATSSGFPGATIILYTNTSLTRNGGAATITIGALGGFPGALVSVGSSTSSGTTYNVGGNNADATWNGLIRNDGTTTFVKQGTGQWAILSANTWSGGLTINGGSVLANNTGGSAVGSGTVVVNSTGALGGTGIVTPAVTVNFGGAISPGSNGVGTVTLTGGLTLNSGALLNFDLGAIGASDKIAITGALALNGILNLTNVTGFGVGTYTLITYTGALSGGGLTVGTHPLGYNYSVSTATANQVRLIVTAQTSPVFGNTTAGGGGVVFSGSGGLTNGIYFVLTTTNVAASASNWTRLATNLFNSSGNFIFTNPTDPNAAQTFFRLQLP
jgi:hypothetical protein